MAANNSSDPFSLPGDENPQRQAPTTMEQRLQKKRMINRIILFCLFLIPLSIWLQASLFERDIELPVNSNILIFTLINLNVILILLVLFLVLRYLAELFSERKRNIPGSKLRTKLVISFLCLSLFPTILLFFVSLQFILSSVDYWFNSSIEDSLQESLGLAQSLLQESREQARITGYKIGAQLSKKRIDSIDEETLYDLLGTILPLTPAGIPTAVTLILDNANIQQSQADRELEGLLLPKIPVATLQNVKIKNKNESLIQETTRGDLVRDIRRITIDPRHNHQAVLITSLLISKEKIDRMARISEGIEGYRKLKYLKGPFKFWLLLILLIVTLLIIFAAIWFGLRIARTITEPVDTLVEATNRVSQGDFDFEMIEVSGDELGQLVSSFNIMTANINSSKKKLEETHIALRQSSQESEQRRRYTEIILQNVSAGVISLDENGHITTINHFAEKLLKINRNDYINMSYRKALPLEYAHVIDRFIEELYATDKMMIEQHLKTTINRVSLSLLINFTRLEDDEGNSIGFVLVFDNLTKLEKMQRMAAWREVARRIAHEIKNPLTPIKLSAQRLRKRYPEILQAEDKVFDRCTQTIINQVEALKQLVGEFSQFARMPRINKAIADLPALARETLILYQEAHKEITFTCTAESGLPVFEFDAEQIKRCLINLLDNAVAVLPDGGKITIELSVDAGGRAALLKVIDNGPGIGKTNKSKLFEPYFSTKKSGTGLGLAIVSTIVTDHGGYVRVQDNLPHGTIFVIELPIGAVALNPEHSHNDFS